MNMLNRQGTKLLLTSLLYQRPAEAFNGYFKKAV